MGRGGPKAGPQLLLKKIPLTTRIHTHKNDLCVLPLTVQDRVSSGLSEQTLNNFGGIIGKTFNYELINYFSVSGDSKPKTFPNKKW